MSAGPAADLTGRIIELAIKVHRRLGPGLLEAVYEKCLCWELAHAGLAFARQVDLPVRYEDVEIASSYRADLIVEGRVILELKSLERVPAGAHRADADLSAPERLRGSAAAEFRRPTAGGRYPPLRPIA